MALNMSERLRQAAAARMAQSSGEAAARLDGMDAAAQPKPPLALLRSEEPASYCDASQIQPSPAEDTELGLTRPDMVAPGQTKLDHAVRPGQTRSDLVEDGLTWPDHQAPNPQATWSDQARPGQTRFTRHERAVLEFVEEAQERVVRTKTLAKKLDMALPTLYKIIRRLRDRGHILAEKDGNDGTYFKFVSREMVRPGQTMIDQSEKPNGQTRSNLVRPGLTISTPYLDRKKKDLSISLETVQTAWPSLAKAGFGPEQIEQIHAALAQLGKPAERVVQGLDHAEWELAEGKMLDKTGQPVADPCAWVYRSLAGQGYYRRPAGYVSAEEQAERDAIVEAKALARTRENARQERFHAWAQGLSREERDKALEGRRGPEEAWLKNVWTSKGEPA